VKVTIRSLSWINAALLLGACAAPPLHSPNGAEVTEEGLQRLTGTAFDELWVRPGAGIRSYTEVVLHEATVEFREVDERTEYELLRAREQRDEFPLSANQQQRIQQTFQERIAEALEASPHFRLVEGPGSGALSVRARLVDFVSKVPPESAYARNDVFVRDVGEATLVIELWDDTRNELLARAINHRRRIGPPGNHLIRANRVSGLSEISRQMWRWGSEVRRLLDQLHEINAA
jgi:hypothetical protein